jgi:hypothetical protein
MSTSRFFGRSAGAVSDSHIRLDLPMRSMYVALLIAVVTTFGVSPAHAQVARVKGAHQILKNYLAPAGTLVAHQAAVDDDLLRAAALIEEGRNVDSAASLNSLSYSLARKGQSTQARQARELANTIRNLDGDQLKTADDLTALLNSSLRVTEEQDVFLRTIASFQSQSIDPDVRFLEIKADSTVAAMFVEVRQNRTFAAGFERGARDRAAAVRLASPALQPFVNDWMATCLPHPELCVFVVGSGRDREAAVALEEHLSKKGYRVFFYDFCVGLQGSLCPPELVGALASTAGKHLFMESAAANLSSYVRVEVPTLKHILSGKSRPIMITRAERDVGGGLTAMTFSMAWPRAGGDR